MSDIILTSYLMGGLGNQMFQIAHTICQSWKNNIPYYFKPYSNTPMQGNQVNKYKNNIFRKINFIDIHKKTIQVRYPFQFTNVNLDFSKSIEFYGYFQSSKYFYGYDEQIKKLFSPNQQDISKITEKYPEINYQNTLSLHVRRGDYLSVSKMLPVINKTYFNKCVELNGKYDVLFVLTDDKKWVKNNISYDNMIIVDNLEDYEELWLMSLCKNNIISNSTFSWWGSYLNKNEDKNIYAPSVWFGPDGEHPFDDIYEKYWKIIKVEYKKGELI